MSKENLLRISLIIILVFACFIYFYRLDKESLSTDEYFSLYAAGQPLKEIIFSHKAETNPNTMPPLYQIISHFCMLIFGPTVFAQRTFSALLGILSIYTIYRLAELLFDRRTGILSALFAVLSYSWFYSFRMHRCYSLLILLTILSFYVFFYWLENKNSKYSLIYLTIINIALTYTHYFAFWVILLQLLITVLNEKRFNRQIKNILLMCSVVFLAYIPWLSNLLHDINKEPLLSENYGYLNTWRQLSDIVMVLFYNFHFRWDPALTIVYLPLIIAGIYSLLKHGPARSKRNLVYLILIFVIPFLTIYLFTYSNRVRYYVPFSFPLLIILALGIQVALRHKLKKFLLVPLVLWIGTFNVLDFHDFFRNPLTENWKLAAQYIKNVPGYRNKEMVFIFQTRYNPPVFAYYYWNNKVARSLINNISNYRPYEKDIPRLKTKDKIYLVSDMEGDEFFEKLEVFPDNAWIWIFRYHDAFFANNFRIRNNGRYFFHQITLNKEIPQIDFYLVKRVGQNKYSEPIVMDWPDIVNIDTCK